MTQDWPGNSPTTSKKNIKFSPKLKGMELKQLPLLAQGYGAIYPMN